MTEKLTHREIDVLIGLSEGKRKRQIGTKLFIGEETVRFHARNLYRKLGANNAPHAVALGFHHGYLQQQRLF